MEITELLSKLSGVEKKKDDHWMARCPAHEDGRPSLSVGVGHGGKILLKCFARCPTESIVGALGLRMSDIMGEKKEVRKEKKPSCRKPLKVVKTYDYQDASGAVIFRVCRMEPKSFCQQVPDPTSKTGWAWGRSRYGVGEVLYRLPRVIEHARAGRVIFVCEGEKDVEALESIGLTATCNPGGAGKWRPEFADCFAGAKMVVVIADNDAGPESGKKEFWQGQRHACAIVKSLDERGIAWKALTLAGGEGSKVKDAADWVAAGGNAELMRGVVAAAPEWDCEKWSGDASASATKGGAKSPIPPTDCKSCEVGFRKRTLTVTLGEPLEKNIGLAVWEASKNDDGEQRNLAPHERRTVVSLVVVAWLKLRGRFFWNKEMKAYATSMYFDSEAAHLLMIESDQFASWLALESKLNRSTNDFKHVMADVHDAALSPETSVGIIPSEFWDRRGDVLYLSCGDSKVARISAGSVELVPNGTDDVLFAIGRVLNAWELLDGPGVNPFDHMRVFNSMACISPHGKMLVMLWVLSLAACHRCKPPLVITGSMGSGKTRSAIAVSEMLGVPKRIATVTEQGEKDFWVSVASGGLLTFDNVDTRVKWFSNEMQAAATDGSQETRRMYTHETLVLDARANCIITSNNPAFASESGLADRLIVVRLDRRIKETAESALSADIERNRDGALTWMVRTLAVALSDSGQIPKGVNRRHPDFAEFAVRCGRALHLETEAVEALRSAETDKSMFAIENDFIGAMILRVMATRNEWEGTSSEMVELIEGCTEGGLDERTKSDLSPRRFGKRMQKLWEHMEVLFSATSKVLHGRTTYSFRSNWVGKVGLESESSTTAHGEARTQFIENASTNQPYPPTEEEESERSLEDL